MRWDEVLTAVMTAAETDATLLSVAKLEANIRLSGPKVYRIPLVEATVLSDDEGELWAPVDIQWDLFFGSMDDLVSAERALRDLFDREGVVEIEGLRMWAFFLEGAALEGPTLDDTNDVFSRALRFRFAPVRERLTKGRS